MTDEKTAKLAEALRKLSISLEAELPPDPDMYQLSQEEFDEKYSKDIVFARLKKR